MKDEEGTFRDHIATVNEKGKRIWIFPKKPKGTFYNYRKLLSYLLLVLLFGLPHIKFHGEPFFLFNILERKFILFGKIFWPEDFYLFAIATILGIIGIILFTIIYGRLFCGWVCPQTIFMEMLFRRNRIPHRWRLDTSKKISSTTLEYRKNYQKGSETFYFLDYLFLDCKHFFSLHYWC